MNALVVEDQRQMRTLVKKMLNQMRTFDLIEEAEDGDAAWDTLENRGELFDLVVCDIKMERMDGVCLLKKCRANPKYKFLPFLMISGDSDQSYIAATVGEWGASDFIIKPFSMETFVSRVQFILKSQGDQNTQILRKVDQLRQEGQPEVAITMLEHAEHRSKLSLAKIINIKGECLVEIGELEQAAEEFQKAMEISTIFTAAYKNHANAHLQLGNLDKAIESLQHIDNVSPMDNERSILIGNTLVQMGEKEKGKQYINNVLRKCPSNQRNELLKQFATIYISNGMYNEAEQAFSDLLDADQDAETFNQLGIALRQQHKYEESEQCYLKALRVHSHNPVILYNLAVLYVARNNLNGAIKYLNKAVTARPDFKDAIVLLEKIEQNIDRRVDSSKPAE